MSNKNRNKGHRFERYWAKVFREELKFPHCKTSRQASRLLDDSGVDLWGIPFNIQLKNGYSKGINYTKIFEDIDDKLKENFIPADSQHVFPSVIIHKRGRKESEHHVIMKASDWRRLVKEAFKHRK